MEEIDPFSEFIKNQRDIEPEISKIVQENFWDMVGEEPKVELEKAKKELEKATDILIRVRYWFIQSDLCEEIESFLKDK